MAAENDPKASEETVTAAATKQRKRRKWDEPAESLVSAGVILPGGLPLSTNGLIGAQVTGLNLTGAAVLSGAIIPQIFQTPSISQNAATIIQKLNAPKIQDEVLAREIVINDAESTIRYRLTKRQTQEEIQKSTGAVVITRGKYRPPNCLTDNEKPLYLHISAGAHLKDTAERIKALDLAVSMVEEILKHGHTFHPGHSFSASPSLGVLQPFNTYVYLGFDPDPSVNIAARIRGPNDQYIGHIMNVTGANVVLQGQITGHPENSAEQAHQPLHLLISSTNSRSLEEARILAENLLDTIAAECGASRMTSSKAYGAVPPPQKLLVGVENSATNGNIVKSSVVSTCHGLAALPVTPSVGQNVHTNASVSMVTASTSHIYTQTQPNMVTYPSPSATKVTSYAGYGGIYPEATPLQQVAQALRNAPASASAAVISPTAVNRISGTDMSIQKNPSMAVEAEQRRQRRKFQESLVSTCGPSTALQNMQQELGGSKSCPSFSTGTSKRDTTSMPPPRLLVQPATDGMPQPPSRGSSMPPPRSTSPTPPRMMLPPLPLASNVQKSSQKLHHQLSSQKRQKAEGVPDTLLKLMEYGDEDDDIPDESSDQGCQSSVSVEVSTSKPFWAV